MKAKRGYRNQKGASPRIGRWLHRYWLTRTCRRRRRERHVARLELLDLLRSAHPP